MAKSDTGKPDRFAIPDADAHKPHCTTTLVRKSKFLAQTCQCASAGAARAFVEAIRKIHPDATHNCWAFAAGPPGDTAQIGCSDDGEPRGTAGKPMLNALLHCGIGQICIVVSRWFGGIKLGTGGLARAYQEAVLTNVASLPVATAVACGSWQIRAQYDWLPQIRKILPACEATITDEQYGEAVELCLRAPLDKSRELSLALAALSNGKIQLLPDSNN